MASTDGALALADETFGERVHRAYRTSRAAYGFNYRDVAARITPVYPVSMQSLQRLEAQADVPRQPRMRLVAYLALIAYGFEPEQFGLNHDNTPLGFVDLKKAKAALDPSNGCSSRSAPAHGPKIPRLSAGQSDNATRSKGDETSLVAILDGATPADLSAKPRRRTTGTVTRAKRSA